MPESGSRNYGRQLLLWGGTVGFGLGPVIDVVIFHLIAQHHHLLSGSIDPHSYDGLRENVMYDGVFLALMVGVLFLGQVMVWRTTNGANERFSGVYLVGSILVGGGLFNLFDGIISHYVIGLHNVVHNTQAWNPHWVAVSLLVFGGGVALLYWSDGAVYSDTQ